MKTFSIILLILAFSLFSTTGAETILPHTGLSISTSFAVKGMLDAWDTPAVVCSTETGCADVIFVIDTSGSMSDKIDELYTEIQEFAYNLEAEGYDGAFGLVTFVDEANLPVGDTLFSDPDAFSDVVAELNGAEGGFEHPIDASYVAIDTFFLPSPDTCKKVIICITDETEEDSDHSLSELINIATMGDSVRIYLVSPSGHPMEPATDATGGRWFDIETTSLDEVLDAVADDIAEFTAVTITIHNNTGSDVSDMTVEINPFSCIDLDNPADSIQNTGPVSAGDSVIVNWAIDEVEDCSGCDDCFQITINAGSNADTIIGCLFVENCDCPGINATVIEPRHCGHYSACDEIVFQFDGCFPVDPNTIVVYVGGSYIYYPDPQLTYNPADQTLTFHPSTPWAEGATVDFWIEDAQDITGCQLRYSQHCSIIVDTTPPIVDIISGFSPSCGATIEESDNISFSASAYDEGAGVAGFMPIYAEITSPSWDPVSIIALPGFGLVTIILTDGVGWPVPCNGDTTWSGIDGIPFAGFHGYSVLCTDLSFLAPDCDCGDEEYFFDFDVNAGEIRNYYSPIIPSQYTICFFISDAVDEADCGPNTDSICCTYYFEGCPPAIVEVGCPYPDCFQFSSCNPQPVSFAISDTSGRTIDHSRTFFTIINWHRSTGTSDTSHISGTDPAVSWSADTATVNWSTISDGDSVVITIDSLFTTDGCRTIPGH